MELNVTRLIDENCEQFSASRMELGDHAGEITWNNALQYTKEYPLVTGDQLDAVRQYLAGFGAWTKQELSYMSDNEVNALLLQFIAGDIREMENCESYEEYEQGCMQGTYSGALYRGDDGQWYYYVGM